MKNFYKKFALLVINQALNLKEGDILHIKGEVVHKDFFHIVERLAYQRGVKYVEIEIVSPQSIINRCNYGQKENLDFMPNYFKKSFKEQADNKWHFLYVDGSQYPMALRKLNQDNFGVLHKEMIKFSKPAREARLRGECPWCIAALPTKKWAKQIFPHLSSPQAFKKLRDIMFKIYKLDKDNPQQEWAKQDKILKERGKFLNKENFSYLLFKNSLSELKISLIPEGKWLGGSEKNTKGKSFLPNLPTEEVFTTPDCRGTSGRVKVTKPVEVLGNWVYDAYFEFENGKVKNYTASKGKELLDNFFNIDKRNKYLGEVALVDINSPINIKDTVFHSILFDENASCHIALGSGFPNTFDKNYSEKELLQMGCNKSSSHIDFMIGSDDLSVKGFKSNGSSVDIISQGIFVL